MDGQQERRAQGVRVIENRNKKGIYIKQMHFRFNLHLIFFSASLSIITIQFLPPRFKCRHMQRQRVKAINELHTRNQTLSLCILYKASFGYEITFLKCIKMFKRLVAQQKEYYTKSPENFGFLFCLKHSLRISGKMLNLSDPHSSYTY